MTTENTIIIFHRPKQNAEESLVNQQAFLENYQKNFVLPTVIDYVTGDFRQTQKITTLINKQLPSKIIVIINSFLSQKEHDQQYDMYLFFNFLKAINIADLYLMDHEGKLYREILEPISFIDSAINKN
jgi:hypothetical protein